MRVPGLLQDQPRKPGGHTPARTASATGGAALSIRRPGAWLSIPACAGAEQGRPVWVVTAWPDRPPAPRQPTGPIFTAGFEFTSSTEHSGSCPPNPWHCTLGLTSNPLPDSRTLTQVTMGSSVGLLLLGPLSLLPAAPRPPPLAGSSEPSPPGGDPSMSPHFINRRGPGRWGPGLDQRRQQRGGRATPRRALLVTPTRPALGAEVSRPHPAACDSCIFVALTAEAAPPVFRSLPVHVAPAWAEQRHSEPTRPGS